MECVVTVVITPMDPSFVLVSKDMSCPVIREHVQVPEGLHVQGVGIEGFHCIQRCLHFRGLE